MSLLKHVLYINLSHRLDRQKHVLEQMNRLNAHPNNRERIQPERFDAILDQNGAIGCTKSHIRCIEIAKQRNYPYVCIMEDDIEFTKPFEFMELLHIFNNEMRPTEWDVLVLGGNIFESYRCNKMSCKRVTRSTTTTGYIVQQHYYDTLLKNFQQGLSLLEKNPKQSIHYAIDQYWKHLQQKDRWFVLVPLTVNQVVSFSDIERRQSNRDRGMLKRI